MTKNSSLGNTVVKHLRMRELSFEEKFHNVDNRVRKILLHFSQQKNDRSCYKVQVDYTCS